MTPLDPSSQPNAAAFDTQADDVFGRIATRYDRLCDLFSLGIHRLWKQRVADFIAREPWHDLLDAASGTGDIVLRVLRGLPASEDRRIVASDISSNMLAIARQRMASADDRIRFELLDAHAIPSVTSASVDLYSMSLGLKICDRKRALHEAMRVLRPGGRLVTLEASNIPWAWVQSAYLRYMSVCMPIIGWIATGGDPSAYKYLLKGIEGFPTAEGLAAELREMGFIDVAFERLSLGIVAIHTARKPR